MDVPVIWSGVGAVGAVAAAGIAAWAARQSRDSARQANAAALVLAGIERERRHAELTPRFRVIVEQWGPGSVVRRLRIALTGPPGLERLDSLTVRIRDDHFRRGEGMLTAGGPTREQVKEQIWGPYMFTAGTGPDQARADRTGRVTVYDAQLPVGEELPFQLEMTRPGSWMAATPDAWQAERGNVLRLAIDAVHAEHGTWTLPCAIDLGSTRIGRATIP